MCWSAHITSAPPSKIWLAVMDGKEARKYNAIRKGSIFSMRLGDLRSLQSMG
jgi:hypothetical protein